MLPFVLLAVAAWQLSGAYKEGSSCRDPRGSIHPIQKVPQNPSNNKGKYEVSDNDENPQGQESAH